MLVNKIISVIGKVEKYGSKCKYLRAPYKLPILKSNNTVKMASQVRNRENVLINFCERHNAKAIVSRQKVSPEAVSQEFSRISKHLDSTEQEQLLRLIDEDKILLWQNCGNRALTVPNTFEQANAPLNIWLKDESLMPLFKELLKMEREGKIAGNDVGLILRLKQNPSEYIENYEALFEEFMNGLRNGQLNTPKKLALAMQRCHTGEGFNFLRTLPKVNNVSRSVSNRFLSGFEKIEQTFMNGRTIDELKAAGGIQLKYSRSVLKENIMKQIEHLSAPEQEQVLAKFGLKSEGTKRMSGLPVFHKNINGLTEVERNINNEIGKFLHKNEIILPQGFENYKDALNEITKTFPEFMFTIGLKQHGLQEHLLAEHMLKVFQENMKNPLYKTLNASDRKILGISSLLHDIRKAEQVVCPGHAFDCSLSVDAILGRMDLSVAEKNRIINLVENHHWLEKISESETFDKNVVSDIANIFKSSNDFTMARIFAESDLKACNREFFSLYSKKLNSPMVKAIEKDLVNIQKNGRIIYTTDVTTEKALAAGAKRVKLGQGAETTQNIVIDAGELGLNENAFGYHAGTSQGLINAYQYGRHGVDGAFSLSLGKNGSIITFNGRSEFLITRKLDMDNIGFIRTKSSNTHYLKGMEYINTEARWDNAFANGLKNKYFEMTSKNITDEQYAAIFREIPRDNISSIHSNPKIIDILGGEKEASAFEKAVAKQNELYTSGGVSEAVAIDLEWGALGTKRNNLNELPFELRKFAQDNNLVIVKVK